MSLLLLSCLRLTIILVPRWHIFSRVAYFQEGGATPCRALNARITDLDQVLTRVFEQWQEVKGNCEVWEDGGRGLQVSIIATGAWQSPLARWDVSGLARVWILGKRTNRSLDYFPFLFLFSNGDCLHCPGWAPIPSLSFPKWWHCRHGPLSLYHFTLPIFHFLLF